MCCQELVVTNPLEGSYIGSAVALDEGIALLGASEVGTVYLFEYNAD